MRHPWLAIVMMGTAAAAACGGRGGGSTGAVAECQAAVDDVRAACVAEDPGSSRLCLYDALRPLCATGRTEFVKAMFDCLKTDACQSPSDPSGAASCVEDLIAASATSADKALGAAICGCEQPTPEPNCDADLPSYSLANSMMLNESDVSAATTCLSSMGCAQEDSCFAATPLQPALACP